MRKVFIDTDILSEYLKQVDINVLRNGDAYAVAHERFTFSSVTVYEIVRGLLDKGASSQAEKALQWLRLNEEIVPSASDYLVAAQTKANARRLGRTVELPDCLIAASATRLELPLVTGNTGDFEVIRQTGLKLTLQNWREPTSTD